MDSLRPNFSLVHLVNDSDISKGSSGHDEVIASPGTIGIEILLLNAFFFQETGSWRGSRNISSWRNMVSCD